MSEKHVSMLYTYMAVASFISRHIFCKLGDFPYVNRFYLYQVGMTISGLCILCIPVARSFVSILMPLIGFRLMDGAMAGQQSLLVLECVGHQKVNRAWGYIMLFAGISATIGPPLIGKFEPKVAISFHRYEIVSMKPVSLTTHPLVHAYVIAFWLFLICNNFWYFPICDRSHGWRARLVHYPIFHCGCGADSRGLNHSADDLCKTKIRRKWRSHC